MASSLPLLNRLCARTDQSWRVGPCRKTGADYDNDGYTEPDHCGTHDFAPLTEPIRSYPNSERWRYPL